MQKAKMVCSVIFFFITCIAAANSQPTVTWEVSDLTNDTLFSKRYAIDGCVILAHRDGNGADVYAYDKDANISHYSRIYRGMKISESHRKSRLNGTFVENKVIDYDIFYAKYINMAKQLPAEAKKLFSGYWGLK